LRNEKITPKLDIVRAERRAFIQYQKASTELERLARVLRAYMRTDHRNKALRNVQISEWEQDVVQAHCEKECTRRDASVAEKNRVNVQMQCDRELKNGGKVTRMEGEAKELQKTVIDSSCTCKPRSKRAASMTKKPRGMRLPTS
jgi:structural maintenance of chromosome 2